MFTTLLCFSLAADIGSPIPAVPVRPDAEGYDPYGTTNYTEFVRRIVKWEPTHQNPYVLAVGVPNPAAGSYLPHCTVPSGYFDNRYVNNGLPDGVYDCFWSEKHEREVLIPHGHKLDEAAALAPASSLTTPTIPVQPVPTPGPFTVPAPAASPGCYTDPLTGRTVCPLKR